MPRSIHRTEGTTRRRTSEPGPIEADPPPDVLYRLGREPDPLAWPRVASLAEDGSTIHVVNTVYSMLPSSASHVSSRRLPLSFRALKPWYASVLSRAVGRRVVASQPFRQIGIAGEWSVCSGSHRDSVG
jgi:hypothetical protein